MKKIVNTIARYIIILFGITLVFLLACLFNDDHTLAKKLISPAFILFAITTIVFLVTYVVHLFWMILEKKKPKNLKWDLLYAIVLILVSIVFDVWKDHISLTLVGRQMFTVAVFIVSGEVSHYIYSWTE